MIKLIPLHYRVLIGVFGFMAMIGGSYIKGHSDGVKSEKNKAIAAERVAMVKSKNATVRNFNKNEAILADIHESPDSNSAPDLIGAAIKRLP